MPVTLQETLERLRDAIVSTQRAIVTLTIVLNENQGETKMNWIKSSASMGNSNCIEFARRVPCPEILIRDSKTPGTMLNVSLEDAQKFIEGAKKGDFDALLDL